MKDELDIVREKASKAEVLEEKVKKLTQKNEAMTELKKQYQLLEEKYTEAVK
jgi:hypothetical protein